jgi:hypothetical protein
VRRGAATRHRRRHVRRDTDRPLRVRLVAGALATPKDTWTVAPTFSTGNLRVASLGAAVGSGIIWTFGGGGGSNGLVIPNTTGDGIVLSVLAGTGQICRRELHLGRVTGVTRV